MPAFHAPQPISLLAELAYPLGREITQYEDNNVDEQALNQAMQTGDLAALVRKGHPAH